MADDKRGIKENIHLHRNDQDDRNDDSEYLPNVRRLEPDIGLGSRCQQEEDRKRRNADSSRREDGPISFRHFLENDPGPPSTFPDLYSCSRQERLNPEVPVVDTDSPDLPDFVQDHLALEHLYFSDSSHPSANFKNLPDFASYVPEQSNDLRLEQRKPYQEGVSARNRVPLDLPVPNYLPNETQSSNSSLPFDLTTQTNNASSSEVLSPTDTELAGSGGRLPDFLSDGHVLGHNNSRHRDARIITSENGSGLLTYTENHNLIIMLRQENNRLRDENLILQSILTKKDDRIKELEDLVMALEISKLQMSSDANTQTIDKVTGSTANSEVISLRKELEASKNEILKLHKEKINAFAESCQRNSSDKKEPKEITNANLAFKVKEMADTSERLVRELLKIITDMQAEFNCDNLQLKTLTDLDTSGDSDDPSDLNNAQSSFA